MKFIKLCVIVLLWAALPVQGYCEDSPADREPSAHREPSACKETSAAQPLIGRSVAVVDDVVTTGATANSIASALLRAGAAQVDIWSIARTSWNNSTG